jgi:hypothetical protein
VNQAALLDPSTVAVGNVSIVGQLCISLFSKLGLVKVYARHEDTGHPLEISNMTLINAVLTHTGPITEGDLANRLFFIQLCGSLVGFIVRYSL